MPPKGFKPILQDDTISFYARNPVDYNEKLSAHYQVELYELVNADVFETDNNLTITLKATESSLQLGKPINATSQQPPPPFRIDEDTDEGGESDGSSDTIIAAAQTTEQNQEIEEENNLMSFSQETVEPNSSHFDPILEMETPPASSESAPVTSIELTTVQSQEIAALPKVGDVIVIMNMNLKSGKMLIKGDSVKEVPPPSTTFSAILKLLT